MLPHLSAPSLSFLCARHRQRPRYHQLRFPAPRSPLISPCCLYVSRLFVPLLYHRRPRKKHLYRTRTTHVSARIPVRVYIYAFGPVSRCKLQWFTSRREVFRLGLRGRGKYDDTSELRGRQCVDDVGGLPCLPPSLVRVRPIELFGTRDCRRSQF
jgi:hypothetical protein